VPGDSEGVQSLLGISFVDAIHGWVSGENGTILATKNGGLTWTKKNIATSQEVSSVSFADSLNGWVVADSVTHLDPLGAPDQWKGSVWHTNDGGATWSMQNMPGNTNLLHAVKCFDSLNVWAVGNDSLGKNSFGGDSLKAAIYHTADGGKTWVLQFDSDADISFTSIAFTNKNIGIVVGFGAILYTKDGGNTWQAATGESGLLRDVQFADLLHAYAVGYDYIGPKGPPVFRSIDGGVSWTRISAQHWSDLNANSVGVFAVSVTPKRVLMLGDESFQCRSNSPWEPLGPDTIYGIGDTTFSSNFITPAYSFEQAFFTDANRGWVVGKYGFKPDFTGQIIFHTADGGATWNGQYNGGDGTWNSQYSATAAAYGEMFNFAYRLNNVHFTDSLKGLAIGSSPMSDGCILKTSDGGRHWSEKDTFISGEMTGLGLASPGNMWSLTHCSSDSLVNGQTVLYLDMAHSIDGGQTWQLVNTRTTGSIGVGYLDINGDAFFSDSLHGWACSGLGTIIHTSDGGASWRNQTLPSNWQYAHMASVWFTDSTHGWLVGESDPYSMPAQSVFSLYTSDGGKTWVSRDLKVPPFGGDLTNIQFTDSLHGWICGESGTIIHTVDGGNSWSVQSGTPSSYSDLRSICFVKDSAGWACGANGTILQITAGQNQTAVSKNGGVDKSKSSIMFERMGNRLSAFTVTLQYAGPVFANIFDLSGRKIKTICNGFLSAGTHRIVVDNARFRSGTFIISVQAGGMREVRKFINNH